MFEILRKFDDLIDRTELQFSAKKLAEGSMLGHLDILGARTDIVYGMVDEDTDDGPEHAFRAEITIGNWNKRFDLDFNNMEIIDDDENGYSARISCNDFDDDVIDITLNDELGPNSNVFRQETRAYIFIHAARCHLANLQTFAKIRDRIIGEWGEGEVLYRFEDQIGRAYGGNIGGNSVIRITKEAIESDRADRYGDLFNAVDCMYQDILREMCKSPKANARKCQYLIPYLDWKCKAKLTKDYNILL